MHSNQAVIITLNYDTLIEMAACELMLSDGPYISDFLRPFGFPAQEGRVAGHIPKTLHLLKLHGSLHWTYSGTEQFFGQSIEDRGLPRWWVAGSDLLPFSLEDGRVPLIIPPTLNKSRYFDNEKIRSLWVKAALALVHARRVFCIGYSLPAGDLLMRFLLQSVGASDRRIPFWVVNCDSAALAHYREALPSRYELKEEFIEEKNFGVVQSFADALTARALDAPTGSSEAPSFDELRRNVETDGNCLCFRSTAPGLIGPGPDRRSACRSVWHSIIRFQGSRHPILAMDYG
jgi:hypothetical protein